MTSEARTVSVTITRPAADVYEYAAEPRNLPAWSFVESISLEDGKWVATVPGARSVMTFGPRNDLGVLDHVVEVDDEVVPVPMRVVPNGDGSEVLFTVFRRPGTDFDADIAAVEKDLAALKSLLED